MFTRASGVWTQQGQKLVASDEVLQSELGSSVAVSADGNTVVAGGFFDNSNAGAAWVFTRTAGVWTQQGPKLVGTGAVGLAFQGVSVAVSADGNTAVVGGFEDAANAGATWVFTRAGGTWTQQGSKLVGTGALNPAYQGGAVALSADASTVMVAGQNDNSNAGAVWAFVP